MRVSNMPHFLKLIRKIGRPASLVNAPSIKAMGGFQITEANTVMLKALEGIRLPEINPTTLKALEGFRFPEINTATLKALEGIQTPKIDSAVLKVIDEFQSTMLNQSTIKSLDGIRSTGLFNSLNIEALAGMPADGILELSSMGAILNIPSITPATLTVLESLQTDIGKQAIGVLKLVDNFPYDLVAREFELSEFPNKKDLDVDEVNRLEEDLLNEVIDCVNASKDWEAFPDRIKAILLHFYREYLAQFIIGLVLILNTEGILELQSQLLNAKSPAQVKQLMNFQSLIDYNDLRKSYRMTTSRVHLRVDPKMQSEIIMVLPRHTLLTVIDRTNRTWIYVRVYIDDEQAEGWVSRRYTAYFR